MKNYSIEISITNLGTGNWKYYNIYDLESYNKAFDDFKETLNKNDNDFEIQIIESNLSVVLDDNELYYSLKYHNETDLNYSLDEIAVLVKYLGIDESYKALLSKYIFITEADNKEIAYRNYCEEIDKFDREYLDIINWELVTRDFEFSGGDIISFAYNNYIVIE